MVAAGWATEVAVLATAAAGWATVAAAWATEVAGWARVAAVVEGWATAVTVTVAEG